MMFHEVYGTYFDVLSGILEQAVDGELTRDSMDTIIREKGFEESILTIPQNLTDQVWPLLKPDMTTPLNHKPTQPITTLQKRWMKALLNDPRIRLFAPPVEGLEDVEPLYPADAFVYFDRYGDGDPYEDPEYMERFRTILTALREKRWLYLHFRGRHGELHSWRCIPYKLEYSPKDDKFRLISANNRSPLIINLGRLTGCELLEPVREEDYRPRALRKEKLVLELVDERNALERCMLHFSHLEKETERIDDRRYRLTLRYEQDDETELLIRVLSFGPVLKVVSPDHFKIRIMPDVHAGMGCTIGTTMTITDKIVPGMVGVDIGCGMETVRISQTELDFGKLDALIRERIPCGRQVRRNPHALNEQIDLSQLRCAKYVNLERAARSIGTLGGGNHFIEVDRGENGSLYIVVHSGSRHLGNEVARFYQDEGRKSFWGGAYHQIEQTIARLKAEGRYQEIQPTIEQLYKEHTIDVPRDLTWVSGKLFDDYTHDMRIVQHFAALNRKAMMDVILSGMDLTAVEQFTTIHNYIDTDNMILRKGSVSAQSGEKLLIPINMRDGSLICIGKGNPDWNYSAPHGAGRLMSRKEAFAKLSLREYREEMSGIYTTCVSRDTLDESPMAYKGIGEIISQIGPTVEIVEQIRPVYNFKASE